ncbi:hypothetical protein F511_32864 [Dorcoceras hygrometricum]|uniref:Uncharacterized protein n=1 Tax=Dorcoceras hygrometricum TaxID=472368 RepID=A0A2Z7AW64_9LAMI|nr:hypothetical protein F511_32864 [Dorcoceras hygrometricum]
MAAPHRALVARCHARWPRMVAETRAQHCASCVTPSRAGRALRRVGRAVIVHWLHEMLADDGRLCAMAGGCFAWWPACCAPPLARDVERSAALVAAVRGLALRVIFVVAAAARRCSCDVVTADFFLGFSSGLSRAAREVFVLIFDIGPGLVDLKF